MSIAEIQEKISPVLKSYGVTYAGIFGSVSRGEDLPGSDIDILIKLGKPMGMFSYMSLIEAIQDILGRKVDIVTEQSLSKFVRPYVMPELKTIYEG
ncbi:MAG: nucleotidyltransferase family protein [Candidatus Taylorbacteria bacterium]